MHRIVIMASFWTCKLSKSALSSTAAKRWTADEYVIKFSMQLSSAMQLRASTKLQAYSIYHAHAMSASNPAIIPLMLELW